MKQQFLDRLLNLAYESYLEGEIPVSAIIVKDNLIIGEGRNKKENNKSSLAHAEIEAIYFAEQTLQSSNLENADIFVTMEPCLMCASALSLARIRSVTFLLANKKMGALGSTIDVYSGLKGYYRPEVFYCYNKVYEDMLTSFFKKIRK